MLTPPVVQFLHCGDTTGLLPNSVELCSCPSFCMRVCIAVCRVCVVWGPSVCLFSPGLSSVVHGLYVIYLLVLLASILGIAVVGFGSF